MEYTPCTASSFVSHISLLEEVLGWRFCLYGDFLALGLGFRFLLAFFYSTTVSFQSDRSKVWCVLVTLSFTSLHFAWRDLREDVFKILLSQKHGNSIHSFERSLQ
ncbi:Serine/threonine-protein kinase MHK [Zea mays]|uniref:Serine/threonine-protein kinase MHK n=1 Tax=Zea mays TaxID=4577 RepID=A0A1D6LJY6_MAIZE|nr:Serine/threonine-protein kinase MHK [Zea mays]